MYNEFFGFNDTPFRLTPDSAFLYMTVQHREALSGLVHSVCNQSGLTVLIGEAGTGKTTLIQVLKTWLQKLQFVIASCNNPILTRDELYDLLLSELGVSCPSAMKNRQLAALQETLLQYRKEQRRAVLIVDEAHRLSPELLEEIRLLLNLETQREKLLEIIIAGQPELGDILRRPDLRQLKQRVSCFCRLHPLTFAELREYIHHRLVRAGRNRPGDSLFPNDVSELIFQYTYGIPRLVNNLCDSALRTAFALQSQEVTKSIISEAAEDLDLGTSVLRDIHEEAMTSIRLAPPLPDKHKPVSAERVSEPGANGSNHTVAHITMPLESYSARQKSLGFLAGLMDRLK